MDIQARMKKTAERKSREGRMDEGIPFERFVDSDPVGFSYHCLGICDFGG